MNRAERRRGVPGTNQKQPNRGRIILYGTLGLVAALLVVGVILGTREKKEASEAPMIAKLTVGQVAPPFSVSTTAGLFSMPNADKKPVLLEVFATWCPHCQRETAVLNKLFDRYGTKIDIVAVSGSAYAMDGRSPESAADVVAFTQRFKTRYPVAYDPELKVMNAYLQGGYPTMMIIGRDGKIRTIRDGEIPEKDLSRDLDSALKG